MSGNNSPPHLGQASAALYQPGPATFTRAPKGKACLTCRRRKLKCDCAHPVCNQCVRFGRERDCEYSEKDQKSRSELLEDEIAVLQARIRELEGAPPAGEPSSALAQLTDWAGLSDDIDFGDLDISSGLPGFSDESAGPSPDLATRSPAEPSYPEAMTLIEAFLPHAHEYGFFLELSRFYGWATKQLSLPSMFDPSAPFTNPIDDLDPLLSVVYLWGSVLTTDQELRARERPFLAHALDRLAQLEQRNSSPCTRPHALRLIQSHVLLANYYFFSGKFAPGRRHTADAVSLVLLHGFHKLRSPRGDDRSRAHLVRAAEFELALPAPADATEEGERTHCFWQVYVLDKTWAALLGCPSLLVEDGSPLTEIDTPWPLAMDEYVKGALPPGYGAAGQTIQNFVTTHDMLATSLLSPLGLRAKAAALLYRCAWFASTSASDPSIRELHTASYEMTDALLDKFLLSLPSLEAAATQYAPDIVRHLAVTHCIARLAVVQLHHAFFDDELKAAAKCMSGSKAIMGAVAAIPPASLAHVDPVLSVLLTVPTQIITTELVNIAASSVAPYKRPLMTCVSPLFLASHIDEAIEACSRVNPDSKLTVLQLEAATAIKSDLAGTDFARL